MPDAADFDNPWKDLIQRFLRELLEFYLPELARRIDWSRAYEFLDQELSQVVRDAESGPRRVDKLVKVWLLDGSEQVIFIHIEVQAQPERRFERRAFEYHYRLQDRYGPRVVTLVVLADDNPSWRPSAYRYELFGCTIRFEFPTVKLLDFEARSEWLEQQRNPFALATLAHLQTLRTARDPEARYRWKLRLVRMLYDRDYARADILELFRFIDWLMSLSGELKISFARELQRLEEERHMPYITSIERDAIERGTQQGMQQGMQRGMERERRELILRLLTRRCGSLDTALLDRIRGLSFEQQQALAEALLDFRNRADLEQWLAAR